MNGQLIFFKYRLFFDFFLGAHVAARSPLLANFMSSDEHLVMQNMVEVITGMSSDNSVLISDLTQKLNTSLKDFGHVYLGLPDPFKDIVWPVFESEPHQFWAPISDKLAAGPETTTALDKLKSSLQAEKRTEDQEVVIRQFDKAEQKMASYLRGLTAALRNSDTLTRSKKLEAMTAIYDAYQCWFKVGLLYAPLIADRTFFVWNGFLFHNQLKYDDSQLSSHKHRTMLVITAMAESMAKTAARNLGSRKLGEVHARLTKNREAIDFSDFMNFACILKSKGNRWQENAQAIIQAADRHSFYLYKMVFYTMNQFKEGVNTGREREVMKRLVTAIQVKRVLKKDKPTEKLITRNLVH